MISANVHNGDRGVWQHPKGTLDGSSELKDLSSTSVSFIVCAFWFCSNVVLLLY